jgi:hypothetical protein
MPADDRLAEIKASDPGPWYAGPWTTRYVDGDPGHYLILQGDTIIATLPDWAGGLALFIATAREGVPYLQAELTEAQTNLATAERRNGELADQLAERTRQLNGLLDALSFDEKVVPA